MIPADESHPAIISWEAHIAEGEFLEKIGICGPIEAAKVAIDNHLRYHVDGH